MAAESAPELREMFNAAHYRRLGDLIAEARPGFDRRLFVTLATAGLAQLTLIQRVRRTSEAARATLPADFVEAVTFLRTLAPHLPAGFSGIWLPDFVGQYGHAHFEESMDALSALTPFSSAEFAIREFLKRDLDRTLIVMERWSRDANEHVRRLASEGSRPRLPWSFRLEPVVADPTRTAKILENLRVDPSLAVRKSVANHLNDISKNHPEWMLARLKSWDLAHPHSRWIARHAARTLIKAGHRGALALFDFGQKPAIAVTAFTIRPRQLPLGEAVTFACTLTSTSRQPQTLAVDYLIHYVKASGATSAKVFKWRELTLAPGERVTLNKRQVVRDFTTRRHHPGRHRFEVQINGRILASGHFDLQR